MSEHSHVTDPAELRKLLKSKELRESELKPAQKAALYGKGNPGVTLYRKAQRDGKNVIVSRTFKPGEDIPKGEGWVDTPTKCGLKKKEPRRETGPESVAFALPDDPEPASGGNTVPNGAESGESKTAGKGKGGESKTAE